MIRALNTITVVSAVVNIKGIKSHKTVEDALSIVENLEHRAGKDAEGKTGDGVGIMVQISHKFFSKECAKLGIELGGEREYGIGMFFLPQDELKRNQAKKMFEIIVEKEGMNFLGWREVTTNPKVLGSKALEKMPSIMQAFIQKPENVEKGLDFDRKLYIARRVFEQSIEDTYVVSCSSRTLICRVRIMRVPLHWSTPVSPPTQCQAGSVHIRIASWYIMVRSTPSKVMQIRCWPVRRP